MSRDNKISDELINAFVDNQLALEDKEELYATINRDQELNRKVCEIRKVRDLMQTAYRDLPATPSDAPFDREISGGINWRNLAAGIVLAMGVVIGWQLNHSGNDKSALQLASSNAANNQVKVLFHLNSDRSDTVTEALSELENTLQYYERSGQKARIEFVTNGSGLSLLRKDVTQHADQIRALQHKYKNLVFVACQNTIDRLKKDHGVTARLLPGVVVIDSGVAQIMRRQQQGWAYIQVS